MLRADSKVTSDHLARKAFLYVRQSSLHQVLEHQESGRRQYALRDRAVALGWAQDQIEVIDSDQGQSGASQDRAGFKRLVTAVGLGEAGLVLGLEVSRLARNSTDWHRLLEMCALTDTLLLDDDGLYDPSHFNDRLLLGMKGTMSEAELHMLRARLQGGLLNKARRGELKLRLPLGFVYDELDRVTFDPNLQVQESVKLLFTTFARVGSALGTVKWFRSQGLHFPSYLDAGRPTKEVTWRDLDFSTALRLLHNPRYAGIYFFGRTRQRQLPGGKVLRKHKPMAEWDVVIPDAHQGYITREQYEANQRQLQTNARAIGADRRRGPAREGPALLQGLVLCGRCGRRMTITYKNRAKGIVPIYYCWRKDQKVCQNVHGGVVDEAISKRIVELVNPLCIETSLKVQEELEKRWGEVDDHHRRQLEQIRYEADHARRRYLTVDPENRLVAAQLEADWNRKLRKLEETRADYEKRETNRAKLTDSDKSKTRSLARDFRSFWKDRRTSFLDRKRILRLLLEDVTLKRGNKIEAHLRFRGGAVETIILDVPKKAWQLRQTPASIVRRIDELLDHQDEWQIAKTLDGEGLVTATQHRFTAKIVTCICKSYKLKPRLQRLRERGLLDAQEIAKRFMIGRAKVIGWHKHGLLKRHRYSHRWWLYENPEPFAASLPGLPEHIKRQLSL